MPWDETSVRYLHMVMTWKSVPSELGMMPVSLTRAHKACAHSLQEEKATGQKLLCKNTSDTGTSCNDKCLEVVNRGYSEHLLTDLKDWAVNVTNCVTLLCCSQLIDCSSLLLFSPYFATLRMWSSSWLLNSVLRLNSDAIRNSTLTATLHHVHSQQPSAETDVPEQLYCSRLSG